MNRSDLGLARSAAWGSLAIILILVSLLRVRLLDVPLERDEGEYAYAAQLIREGVPPYAEAVNMKLPGTYYAYAAIFACFGESVRGIHFGLLVVSGLTTILIFALARAMAGDIAAIAAAAFYALLALSPSVLGFSAHATHFVNLFLLLGCLGLYTRPTSYLVVALSGVAFGLAILMKQHAFFFAVFAIAWLILTLRTRGSVNRVISQHVGILISGMLAPSLLLGIYLARHGLLHRFWYWTVEYAAMYGMPDTWHGSLTEVLTSLRSAALGFEPAWMLGLAGLAISGNRRFLLPFAAFSFAAVLPGLHLRSHYFVLVMPALALGAGATVDRIAARIGRVSATVCVIAILAWGSFHHREVLWSMPPDDVSRRTSGTHAFVLAREIAHFVAARTSVSDRILVFGSEPEIYFYAQRRAATSYLYLYEMLAPHERAIEMQQEMAREVERSSPRLIVAFAPAYWAPRWGSPRYLGDWTNDFAVNYRPIAFFDFSADGQALWIEGEAAREYQPGDREFVAILARRDGNDS